MCYRLSVKFKIKDTHIENTVYNTNNLKIPMIIVQRLVD